MKFLVLRFVVAMVTFLVGIAAATGLSGLGFSQPGKHAYTYTYTETTTRCPHAMRLDAPPPPPPPPAPKRGCRTQQVEF